MSESFMTVQRPSLVHLGPSDRDERRRQAGPLPLKRGEIGFVQGVHEVQDMNDDDEGTEPTLPLHHPADRDYASSSRRSSLQAANETRTVDESTPNSSTISKSLFGRLKSNRATSIGGLQLRTLILLTIQLIALGGTIALWVYAARRVNASMASSSSSSSSSLSRNSIGSVTVFIHVIFAIGTIGQLVFLERRIYRLRGERYQHLHGDSLPTRHRRSLSSPDSIVSAAPWNRPPLPTYATVLAQSGVRTGDVEDNLIAIPPPPAYGNVRGSRLLESAG